MDSRSLLSAIKDQIGRVISGQEQTVEQTLVCLIANGHALLEGVPGLAKTLLVRSMSRSIGLPFGRIQFTPDLMPSDIVGTRVFDPKTAEFKLRLGPIFVGMLLADEVNRTPPKTQAALLEAMEERSVTIDGDTHRLPEPFLVFATQNPIDFEGTYPLPEAQQDRFLLKIVLDYPSERAELQVLRRHHEGFEPQNIEKAGIEQVASVEDLHQLQAFVKETTVEDKLFDYILAIVGSTRKSDEVLVGASPRGGIGLLSASKALAVLRDRDFVIPDDIKEMAIPVLRHRVILRPESEIEGSSVDRVLKALLDAQSVPR